MNEKKNVIILVTVVVLIALLLLLWSESHNDWEAPSGDWFLEFNSVDEIEYARGLLESGSTDDLIEFVREAGNGNNAIESERDMAYFFEILDRELLPVDSGWVSFAYEHSLGMFFIQYNLDEADELSFIITLGETFDRIIAEASDDHTLTDITDEIVEFRREENSDVSEFRIGNGIKAFSFYRHSTGLNSVRDDEDGFTASLTLDVEGHAISSTVSNATSLEIAFEALANAEFAKGGWR